MKCFSLFFFLFSVSLYAQIDYKKSYFIDSKNNKIDCLIKNIDWKNSPESFSYKIDENSNSKEINISEVLEFRIYDTDQYYVRFNVTEPLKTDDNDLVKNINSFIFLKVLLKGEATLYEYHNFQDFFFFSVGNEPPMYLPHEKRIDENNKVKESNKFRKALYENLKCDKFSIKTFSNLRYISDDLVDFFREFNQCKNQAYEDVYMHRTKSIFRFKLNGGVHFNSELANKFAFDYGYDDPPSLGGNRNEKSSENTNSFDPKSNFSFGVEAELVLPFDKNKWSVFVAPNYQSISDVNGTSNFTEEGFIDFSYSSTLSYSFIEIPIGLRYYFNLNNKMQLFAQLAYTQYIVLNSEQSQELEGTAINATNFEYGLVPLSDKQVENYGGFLGLGLNYKTKFAIALNYYFSKNIKISENTQSSSNGTISVIASYTIF